MRGPQASSPSSSVSDHIDDIASANWHASARFVAASWATASSSIWARPPPISSRSPTEKSLLADIPMRSGSKSGELVYTGMVRSFLMSVVGRVPFQGRSMPLMNEYFANMADVYRLLGDLPAGADQHATADGREKTIEGSCARLARMLGLDAADASKEAWIELARAFREAQLRTFTTRRCSCCRGSALPPEAPDHRRGHRSKDRRCAPARASAPLRSLLAPSRRFILQASEACM